MADFFVDFDGEAVVEVKQESTTTTIELEDAVNILKLFNEKYGITEEDFPSAELECVPAGKPRDIGFDRSMIGSYGHDDRVCAYPCLMAVIDAKTPKYTAVTVLADKEETGSDGNTGMCSTFLQFFIEDLARMQGGNGYRALRA